MIKTIIQWLIFITALALTGWLALLYLEPSPPVQAALATLAACLAGAALFVVGSIYSFLLMRAGARLSAPAQAAGYRAEQQALSLAGRVADVLRPTGRTAALPPPPKAAGLPALPLWAAEEGQFTIAGLDDEPLEEV